MPTARPSTPAGVAQLCLFTIDADEADLQPENSKAAPSDSANSIPRVDHEDSGPCSDSVREQQSAENFVGAGGGQSSRDTLFGVRRTRGLSRFVPTFEHDFRITDAHQIGAGGWKQKLKDNLEAIRTLKEIESEERSATAQEQARLVRYVGWGAFPQVFEQCPREEWKSPSAELATLLTAEEFASARASTPNAHYTSAELIRFLWHSLERLGLQPGVQVLEPACGVGHFFGLMPVHLLAGSRRTGVELDSISARIAQKLYPDSVILESAFEQAALPDQFYDIVIGNVPFGNVPVYDPTYRRQPALTRSLHDYFLVKSVDKVRGGGLIALITSFYSMDKRDAAVRRHLAERATLIAAYRLPNTAFLANAGTKVTTDVLFLRKN
ncbi:MAG: N-6 DNA methylase [Bryobacteraceae bacterium]